jgi:hypothetical protein
MNIDFDRVGVAYSCGYEVGDFAQQSTITFVVLRRLRGAGASFF